VHELVRPQKYISLQQNELLKQYNIHQDINKIMTADAVSSGQEPPRSQAIVAGQDAARSGIQEARVSGFQERHEGPTPLPSTLQHVSQHHLIHVHVVTLGIDMMHYVFCKSFLFLIYTQSEVCFCLVLSNFAFQL